MMNSTLTPLNFRVSLSLLAHSQAQKFSAYHPQTSKAKQVYLNTLAVYAVQFYLECLDFEIDLEESLCKNPVMQTLMDIADLELKDYGKIECRPILENHQSCVIPSEVQSERIAYVLVQLNPSLTEATILGFIDKLNGEVLQINHLQSLDDFPIYLNSILNLDSVKSTINLREWLQNQMREGWQSLETILGSDQILALGYRSGKNLAPKSPADSQIKSPPDSIRGAKLIDLGEGTGNPTVILLIAITPETETEIGIRVQVHPACGTNYLLENIKLSLLSETGELLIEIDSRRLDNFIQLPYFHGVPDEKFIVELAYKNNKITEEFII